MYISPRATEGGRGHRLALGTMLFLIMLMLGVGMTATALNSEVGVLMRVGMGVGAVSTYTVAWWCARYWYAAFCQGRRAEPVPEPNPWPWALPYVVLFVSFVVTGVRQLSGGNDGGWFALGFAAMLCLPVIIAVATGPRILARAPRRGTPPAPAEPPRPRRDWGPIG
ncbi:hypothetical protein ACWGII_10620 [Streptomyces sp. NPDC054855]